MTYPTRRSLGFTLFYVIVVLFGLGLDTSITEKSKMLETFTKELNKLPEEIDKLKTKFQTRPQIF
jgi:hypothetical protein